LGYEFELDLKSKSLIKKIYVLISGKSFSEDGYQFLEIEKIPDESICYEELLKLTKSCIDNVFEENPKLLPSFKESLSNMKKSLNIVKYSYIIINLFYFIMTEEIETLRRDRKFGGYFFISSNGKIKQPVSDDYH